MTTLYLSSPGGSAIEAARTWDWKARPLSLLVSFAYLKQWNLVRPYFAAPESLMLDSGAWTAHTSGKAIDLDALAEEGKRDEWDEVVSLDVIGDANASRTNYERMVALGCTKAMPVFHIGEPWELLDHYVRVAPKVGIGGVAALTPNVYRPFFDQVFARAWPKKMHAFGVADRSTLLMFPFHSADASTWILAPTSFKNWMFKKRGAYVQRHIPIETGKETGRGERMRTAGVRSHMEAAWALQQEIRQRWSREMARLEGNES